MNDEQDEHLASGASGASSASSASHSSHASLQAAIALLEAFADDRRLLASLDRDARTRLLIAAGRVSRPEAKERRQLSKAFRKQEKLERRSADDALLAATAIRRTRAEPVFPTPPLLAGMPARSADEPDEAAGAEGPRLADARKCYVCKAEFRVVHRFYDQMCSRCGDFNLAKREQTADLGGRVALVTGARLKIGYHAAIKLLRAGARVIVTTRFPRDAAERYAREPDFESFRERLVVHGLDLRHTPSIETFARHLENTEAQLDFIIHNACQTVRRPAGFYTHLLARENAESAALGEDARALVASHEALRAETHALRTRSGSPGPAGADAIGLTSAPALSQLALLDEDHLRGGAIFPEGSLDRDLQQVDLRDRNSWRLTLAEVPTIELLEVQLVNAVAPFVLNAKLKNLMCRTSTRDKHIVNVSAMEGQFYRDHKTDKHPHTNMAKAALNMMTRTSAADYVKDGIHMNSVDTGWVTDEDPAELASAKQAIHRFHPPLDIVDGAARIVDPVFDGINTGEHRYGLFLKDYVAVPW